VIEREGKREGVHREREKDRARERVCVCVRERVCVRESAHRQVWDCDTLALREKFAPSRKEVGKPAVVLACSSSGGLPVAFVGRGGLAVRLSLSLSLARPLSLSRALSHSLTLSLPRTPTLSRQSQTMRTGSFHAPSRLP